MGSAFTPTYRPASTRTSSGPYPFCPPVARAAMTGASTSPCSTDSRRRAMPRRRTAMKPANATCLSLAGGTFVALCGSQAAAPPPLPVPCAAAACGSIKTWVSSGAASLAQSGSTMNITQATPSAILNWQSFDIAAGNTVNFKQPSSSSVALNQIFEANPSQIFGTLTANGEVYLINPNGIVFGPHSSVNVGGLVASSLAISQKAIDQNGGINLTAAIAAGQPAF